MVMGGGREQQVGRLGGGIKYKVGTIIILILKILPTVVQRCTLVKVIKWTWPRPGQPIQITTSKYLHNVTLEPGQEIIILSWYYFIYITTTCRVKLVTLSLTPCTLDHIALIPALHRYTSKFTREGKRQMLQKLKNHELLKFLPWIMTQLNSHFFLPRPPQLNGTDGQRQRFSQLEWWF